MKPQPWEAQIGTGKSWAIGGPPPIGPDARWNAAAAAGFDLALASSTVRLHDLIPTGSFTTQDKGRVMTSPVRARTAGGRGVFSPPHAASNRDPPRLEAAHSTATVTAQPFTSRALLGRRAAQFLRGMGHGHGGPSRSVLQRSRPDSSGRSLSDPRSSISLAWLSRLAGWLQLATEGSAAHCQPGRALWHSSPP